MKTVQTLCFALCSCSDRRGVTTLDGARGKKQIWRPRVRTWGLPEANLLYRSKYLWHRWDFSPVFTVIQAPPQWFSAWGIVTLLSLLVTPLSDCHAIVRKSFWLCRRAYLLQHRENHAREPISHRACVSQNLSSLIKFYKSSSDSNQCFAAIQNQLSVFPAFSCRAWPPRCTASALCARQTSYFLKCVLLQSFAF